MDNYKRAAVAFIAGTTNSSDNKHNAIYDYTNRTCHSFSGNKDKHNISVYDYKRRCYLQGATNNIFDFGTRSYLSIHHSGNTFNGFDFQNSAYFSGVVNGNVVSIFENGKYYNYSLI